MGKEAKTNAMRILDKNKIEYETITYECKEFIDGVHAAEVSGIPAQISYKTLVMQGKSMSFYVFVVPVLASVDLKKAAKAVGEKSMTMIPTKDITNVTGYVRGGCSPIGMKKQFPTVIDASAGALEQICISGGRIGLSLRLSPKDLQQVTSAEYADIVSLTLSPAALP
ncbi:MAG: Cys-tRNA(Pro) deacylase [Clostridium sp.]|nr:Cys-tRNA(Pro) deacylase [Lachnoclostridium sp.]MCM1251208.1 Cys-tRNA(Pro) deacylase [Clostridium sp.]